MELKQITAAEFRAMVIAGGQRLNDQMELINSLNVFPVPDGDTGTNMNMSFTSGVENLKASNATSVGELAGALAKGLLMGARGNSGVILSQIFRGFSQAVAGKDVLDANDFVAAFAGGVESAYKAVMKPVEGTILTVARESAIRGERKVAKTDNIIEVMQSIVTGAEKSLAKTPELLPVLKQVGVVDSGGKGLLSVYEGFLAALKGEAVIQEGASEKTAHAHAMFEDDVENPMTLEEITYGYCTEIMVRIGQGPTTIKPFDYDVFRQTLDKKGDSLLVVADDEIVKVHIHTENPGEIMQLGQEFGELIKIKVDNMREQVRTLEANEASQQTANGEPEVSAETVAPVAPATPVMPLAPAPEYAIIAVAAGEGVTELYRSMGAEVLSGGQTMNPSTEDFVKLIENSNAKRIVLLPNNKNIIMAAEQASQVAEVPTIVIPTKTIPEGIAALMAFNPEQEIEENYTAMNAMSQQVKSGQITYSIRDTEIDGVTIKKDDFMGIVDGKIMLSVPDIVDTLNQTLLVMMDEDSEIVTIIVGEEGSTEAAETVIAELAAQFEDVEFEIVQGGQPVYHYIISVE
ncbi:DAK2 domain-containing protein [Tuanshanicoccus lijuaniae]|uniref:DAK2 domain-containing protein n=1 Tax=Aerococcaceae bacterium zg-1292 TaxID=2774330 RepID=UPI001937051F|nr:DAK2 domain-containing protein [Aerococcaceae bacterium zg-1292]MBF6978280.1 DAK2 domain-containing protein [Aerococcaceae bacterium zg-BR22]QQA37426.1 DAK2 domain-containing protein [Aerococcaceae bacterium zg-1292]